MVQNTGNCWRTSLLLVTKSFPYISFQILGTLHLGCPPMVLAPSSTTQRHHGQSFYSTTTSLKMSGSTRRISSQLGIYQALKTPRFGFIFVAPHSRTSTTWNRSLCIWCHIKYCVSPCLFNRCFWWHSHSLHDNVHEGTQCNSSMPHVWDSRCA